MSKVSYDARCGCGQIAILVSLARAFECRNCRWPITYASKFKNGSPVEWTLSRHVGLAVRASTSATPKGEP